MHITCSKNMVKIDKQMQTLHIDKLDFPVFINTTFIPNCTILERPISVYGTEKYMIEIS